MTGTTGNVRRLLRSPLFVGVLVVVLWFVLTFMVWPNLTLLAQVFRPEGRWSFEVFPKLLGSERAMTSLRNSFVLAVVLSVTVNVVGVFIVLVTRYFDIRGSRLLFAGFATSLLYGGVVMASGYNLIYGPQGFVTNALLPLFPGMDPDWFTGMLAVVLVSTFAGTGNHLLFVTGALGRIDFQTVEAARQLGASTGKILWSIVLPVLRPMIFSITVLTFLGGLGAMAVPLVLGGPDFQTISPMILTFSNSLGSRDLAATLAMILGLATMALLAVLNRLERGGTYFSVSKVPADLPRQKIHDPFANAAVHAGAYLLFLVYAFPPVLIVIFSFTDAAAIASGRLTWDSLTLDNYRAILTDPAAYEPFVVSIVYSAAASVVVVVAMLLVARIIQRFPSALTRWVEYLLHLPWILPATMIALALVITFGQPQALVGGRVLTGTVVLLAIGYLIEKIPFTLRMLKASFLGINDSVEEAASILGAGPLRTFRTVLLPLVVPAATAIAALNFNSLLDNYDTAVFLSHPFHQPLGIFIQNATTSESINDTTALTFVYTVLLMLISGLVLWLVYGRSARSRRPGPRRPRSDRRPARTVPVPSTPAGASS
jgi:iron(III) transport system permease protein